MPAGSFRPGTEGRELYRGNWRSLAAQGLHNGRRAEDASAWAFAYAIFKWHRITDSRRLAEARDRTAAIAGRGLILRGTKDGELRSFAERFLENK